MWLCRPFVSSYTSAMSWAGLRACQQRNFSLSMSHEFEGSQLHSQGKSRTIAGFEGKVRKVKSSSVRSWGSFRLFCWTCWRKEEYWKFDKFFEVSVFSMWEWKWDSFWRVLWDAETLFAVSTHSRTKVSQIVITLRLLLPWVYDSHKPLLWLPVNVRKY